MVSSFMRQWRVSLAQWNFRRVSSFVRQHAIDPELIDSDFRKTWTLEEGYDGPSFNKSGFTPLGYGDYHRFVVRTNLGGTPGYKPEADRSFTAYLRATFTPEQQVTGLGIEGIFDDGAVVYVNGQEVYRFNLSPDKDAARWDTLADGPAHLIDRAIRGHQGTRSPRWQARPYRGQCP